MGKRSKIYECDFEGEYLVGNCLILTAYNQEQSETIAKTTITHTSKIVVTEVILDKPRVIQYLSSDY